jgi:hypothetical protein
MNKLGHRDVRQSFFEHEQNLQCLRSRYTSIMLHDLVAQFMKHINEALYKQTTALGFHNVYRHSDVRSVKVILSLDFSLDNMVYYSSLSNWWVSVTGDISQLLS